MGRKSKYSLELSQKICKAIATQGGHESGWKAGGISEDTFYSWIRRFPEFAEAVERASQEFRKNCPNELKTTALERLEEALKHGQRVTWKTTSTRKMERFNRDGELLWYQIETTQSEHLETRPTPQWAIERVVEKPIWRMDQLEAIASEFGLQLVVKDAQLFNSYLTEIIGNTHEIQHKEPGLSEEAADEIRRRILGLDS